jgi:uncharacterized iron-regulated protein
VPAATLERMAGGARGNREAPGLAALAGWRLGMVAFGLAAAGCAVPAVGQGGASGHEGLAWEAPLRQDHPLVGRILDATRGEVVSEDALVARLARADFVLLGERHGHPDHHRLQARVLEALVARGRRPVVVLEMLATDVEPGLAAWRKEPEPSMEGLRRAVAWDASGWPDFGLYRPIFDAALTADLPIAPGDASQELLQAARRQGVAELPEEAARRLGLAAPMPGALRRAHEESIRDAHCGHAPGERLASMVEVQWLRDAHLAAALVEAAARADAAGAVLIAGAGHVRRDRGVPWHLGRLSPGASVAAVGLVELPRAAEDVDESRALVELLGGASAAFDWLWLTPALDDLDPCERFRESLEALGR